MRIKIISIKSIASQSIWGSSSTSPWSPRHAAAARWLKKA